MAGSNPVVSTGIGGAGNIASSKTAYRDGGITREGDIGDHHDGAFSTGRGGAANIGSPGLKPTKRKDHEVVPEAAIRSSTPVSETVHFGRGGEGNMVKARTTGENKDDVGLGDKLKEKLFSKKTEK